MPTDQRDYIDRHLSQSLVWSRPGHVCLNRERRQETVHIAFGQLPRGGAIHRVRPSHNARPASETPRLDLGCTAESSRRLVSLRIAFVAQLRGDSKSQRSGKARGSGYRSTAEVDSRRAGLPASAPQVPFGVGLALAITGYIPLGH